MSKRDDDERITSGSQPDGLSRAELLKRGAFGVGSLAIFGGLPARTFASVAAPLAAGPTGVVTLAYSTIGSKVGNPVDLDVSPAGDIAHTCFNGLLRQDPKTLNPVPVLAEKWEIVNETTYRFHLRKGMRFSNGAPLTARDVKASLETFISKAAVKASAGNTFAYTPWLSHVKIIDEHTVDVISTHPYRIAPRSMAVNSFIFPASATPIDLSAVPPGNGVYRQSSVAIGDHITVVASPRARGLSTAKAKSITFRGIADDAARVAALEAGDVDWINNVPPDSIDELASKGFLINSQPSIRNMYITFNFKKPGPWHDERVRQAMNYAIDKNAINKALFAGRAHISVAPEPPQIAYTPTGLPPYTYNPQKAKQLLAAAGYANGFNGGTLVAPAGRYLKDKETAEAVQAALSEFGIQYKLLTLDIATFFDQAPNYELGLASWTATEGDPAAGLYGEATFQFPYDLGGYDTDVTPRLRKALVEGTTIFDEKKATRFYGQLERQVWLQAPRIFLFELPMIWAHRKGLAGFTAVPTDDYDWTQVRIS